MSPTERLSVALAEITRREDVARAATPGPWSYDPSRMWVSPDGQNEESVTAQNGVVGVAATGPVDDGQSMADGAFIALNDPLTVLAGLARDRATLERHCPDGLGGCRSCARTWPCPDGAAVLDHYAPEETP